MIDLNLYNEKDINIFYASKINDTKLIEYCLEYKLEELLQKNENGQTPLLYNLEELKNENTKLILDKLENLNENINKPKFISKVLNMTAENEFDNAIYNAVYWNYDINNKDNSISERILKLVKDNNVEQNFNYYLYPADYFVEKKDLDYLNLLKKYDFPFKKYEQNNNELHYSVILSKPIIVKWFIDNGININEQNINGETPLHLAAMVGNKENVKFLLSVGADDTIKNNNNKTPLELLNSKNAIKEILEFKNKENVKSFAEFKKPEIIEKKDLKKVLRPKFKELGDI